MITCTAVDGPAPSMRYLGDIEGLAVYVNGAGTQVVFRTASGIAYALVLDPATDYHDLTELLAVFWNTPCGRRVLS